MTQLNTYIGRTARRLAILAIPLLVATTGTAAGHGGGSYGGGMMGGGGWGLFGGAMGLWGLLWMAMLVALPLYIVWKLWARRDDERGEHSMEVLRERYARGELSDEEFERRREKLERSA
ncbi:SHOCT domain-containing protein [Haloarcula laminariae]|uniref:SHOCT domain-containing protein n=1 Tax=Haloarcula laminariae TaxID=2961577 RepID=UPI0021C70EE2|nr:SHOCT domain-containing protein [Halomicroarcula laminariae]